jgi:predicted NBD/HSP70 family sugar kinase/predicted transcriptional regulator
MTKKGVNMNRVKKYNRSLILDVLESDQCSRKDIASKVNLTPASVSNLVNELINEGWITETGESEQTNRVGRRKMYLKMNPTHKYIIGINIETDRIRFCLTNLNKEILTCYVHETIPSSIDAFTKIITTGYHYLLNTIGLSEDQLLGVGVGIIGEVDATNGISLNAYGLWSHPVNLEERLSKSIRVPIVIENNVRALALAEAKKHPNTNTLTFVKYGPGIGSALVHQNGIYTGDFNNALELGHTIVHPHGKLCNCGQEGCLETVASIKSILNTLIEKHLIEKTDTSPMATLATLYENKNTEVVNIIDEAMSYFAIALINLMKVLDTEYIVLYGAFFKKTVFLNLLKANLQENVTIKHFKLIQSDLPDDQAIGPIYVAYKKLLIDVGGQHPPRKGD